MSAMEFGVQVWDMGVRGAGNGPESMITVARRAEELGFDAVWINDHVVTPLSEERSYYPIGGAPWPLPADADVYDPLVVMAMLATATDTIRIGTSTLVVPLRPALPTAKALVSIDQISDGRFELGFASGWWREEFELLGLPFEARGAVLDEYLEIFDLACRGGTVEFHGTHADFEPVPLYPVSRQRPRFPMISCGTSTRALKRGARYDGLFRILTGVEEIAPIRARMRTEAQRVGNDADRLRLYDYQPMILTEGAAFEGVADLPLAGSADKLLTGIAAYERAGMDQLVHGFTADPFGPMPEQLENMEQFAIEVMQPYRQ
jgi:probable F420-dependent oxidoreductase